MRALAQATKLDMRSGTGGANLSGGRHGRQLGNSAYTSPSAEWACYVPTPILTLSAGKSNYSFRPTFLIGHKHVPLGSLRSRIQNLPRFPP